MLRLYFNLDTGIISLNPFDPQSVELSVIRGAKTIQLIFTRGDAVTGGNYLLLNYTVGLVIVDPQNRGAAMAGTFWFTSSGTADGGWLGTINDNSSAVQKALKALPNFNGGTEQAEYDAEGAFVIEPVDGSAPTESRHFVYTIGDANYQTGMPPADIVATWSSPAQLQAAIAAAASAQPRFPNATADAQLVTVNADQSVHLVGLPTTFPTLTVTGNGTVGGTLGVTGPTTVTTLTATGATNVAAVTASGAGTFNGPVALSSTLSVAGAATLAAVTAQTLAGDGNGITNLNAGALAPSTVVPLGNLPAAVAGGFHYVGAWDANANNPTLTSGVGTTGAVYRVSAAGGTSLDGISTWLVGDELAFDGTRWDKFNGAGNEVLSVDGVPPVFGAVTLPGDQLPGMASKRTLGTGAQQAAPGNDTRFPATVTGLRKGGGAGSQDTAAVAGTDYLLPTGSGKQLTDVAPFHLDSNTGAGSNPGQGFTLGSSVSSVPFTISGNDLAGQVSFNFSNGVPVGTAIGTFIFATTYNPKPKAGVLFWPLSVVGSTGAGGSTPANYIGSGGVLTGTLKADGSGFDITTTVAIPSSGGVYTYAWLVPVR